jgi:galactonate dehydratase
MGRRLAKYHPAWYEEPVTPNSLDLLKEVKAALPFPITAGERLYTLEDFYRLISLRAADVINMDPAHCGGLLMTKKIAAMAQAQDILVSPHCPIGPVALAAAIHVGWSTPNALILENFAEFDVPWRNDLVCGWNPVRDGEFLLPDAPGLGVELDTVVCAAHPYVPNSFPSLWDSRWLQDFTQNG